MKATEARAIALEKNTNDINSQYSKIKTQITTSAKNGKYDIYYYEPIKDDVRTKLESEGYNVGVANYDQRDGSVTKITW